MNKNSIGFIGGGRITKIFLEAFRNKNIEHLAISVYDINEKTLSALKSQFSEIKITNSLEEVSSLDIVVIALHPPVIMETLNRIKGSIKNSSQVVSLAPKITIGKIANTLGIKNIARIIPNATSYINEGYNPICFSKEYDQPEKESLLELLAILGYTFETEESKLEAYAIISAMLPTYFWFQFETLQKIGNEIGLNKDECNESIEKTLQSSIQLYFNSGISSEEVMDLIPVKPIGEHEEEFSKCYNDKLVSLYNKIKA